MCGAYAHRSMEPQSLTTPNNGIYRWLKQARMTIYADNCLTKRLMPPNGREGQTQPFNYSKSGPLITPWIPLGSRDSYAAPIPPQSTSKNILTPRSGAKCGKIRSLGSRSNSFAKRFQVLTPVRLTWAPWPRLETPTSIFLANQIRRHLMIDCLSC